MKKLIAAAVVVAITLVGLTPAQAAAKVKCTPTKAVGHAEMKVKPAENPQPNCLRHLLLQLTAEQLLLQR